VKKPVALAPATAATAKATMTFALAIATMKEAITPSAPAMRPIAGAGAAVAGTFAARTGTIVAIARAIVPVAPVIPTIAGNFAIDFQEDGIPVRFPYSCLMSNDLMSRPPRFLSSLLVLLLLVAALLGRAQDKYRFDGTIVDANTGRTLSAVVEIFGATPEATSRLTTSRNGVFSMFAQTAGPYRFVVSSPAYATQELSLSGTAGTPYVFTVRLVPLEVGSKVPLNSIRFKQSKAELLPESYEELDRLLAVMEANPSLEIQLNGHTDNQGDPAKNQVLSEQRVQTVVAFLTRRGIKPERLRGKGFGGSQPIASNDQEATRRLNRRVEFEILKR